MDRLNSAESVTKFLRSKNGSYVEIVQTCHKLLNNDYDIYLPNKDTFILELLCDRLNDFNSGFKSWKYEDESWELMKQVWTGLGLVEDDRHMRNRILNKLRVIQIVIAILNKDPTEALMDKILDFIVLLRQEVYIDIEEHSAIELLTAFSHRLLSLTTTTTPESSILKWTNIIRDLYNIPKSSATYSPSKKSYAKFIQECLSPVLQYVNTCEYPSVTVIFEDIIKKAIFNDSLRTDLVKQVSHLLKSKSNILNQQSITTLYRLTVDNMSSKDFKLCEELFTAIVTQETYSDLAESLLAIIRQVNKTLSPEFLKSLYDEAIGSTSNSKWKLIVQLFNLDIELAMDNCHTVITETHRIASTISLNDIGKSILHAYGRGRELNQFIVDIWPVMNESNKYYTSQEFVAEVATVIDELSGQQLSTLIVNLYKFNDPSALQPLLMAVLKGILTSSVSKREHIKSTILDHTDIINTDLKGYWELRYYLLCLYADDYTVDITSFKAIDSPYYYFSLFRLLEVERIPQPTDSHSNSSSNPQGDKYLKLVKTHSPILITSIERWLIVLETWFTTTQLSKFVELIFSNLDIATITSLFQANAEYVFERKLLVAAIANYLIENMPKTKTKELLPLIPILPVQALDRRSRSGLVDTVFKSLHKSTHNLHQTIAALDHLTSVPGPSSFEKDPQSLFELVSSVRSDYTPIALSIVSRLWTFNINQIANEESLQYITQTLDILQTYFNGKPSKVFDIPKYEVAFCILSSHRHRKVTGDVEQSLTELKTSFISAATNSLEAITNKKVLDLAQANWLLKSFSLADSVDVDIDVLGLVIKVNSKLDSADTSATANNIRTVCFNLVASTLDYQHTSSTVYVLALYISLVDEYNIDLTEGIEIFVKRISDNPDLFSETVQYVLESLREHASPALVDLISLFIRSFHKDFEHSRVLYVEALSTIISSIDTIPTSSLIHLLKIVKDSIGDKVWLFSQHALETTIAFIDTVCIDIQSVDLYICATQCFSYILLYHRYKLASRHHLILSSSCRFLEYLCNKHRHSPISSSTIAATSYARVLENLCEPSHTSSAKDKSGLTSSSVLTKRALRKHLPILIINYIYLNLKYNFDSAVNDALMPGIYSAFDVVSKDELRLVSSSLDIPGKTFFRSLYANYIENGKWKDN
ncbi:Urb2/Npa2 family-domain-containing protein [Scheffersomyces amazonensis]|uniref:Urb2/Npa2 family-domain-containing protein n=1 Tax=Scheffersomyces amazonensis TaxID=1078765 RepID=UPI00315DAD8C